MITVVTPSTEALAQRSINRRPDVGTTTATDPDEARQPTPLLRDLEQLRRHPKQLGGLLFRQIIDERAQPFLAGHDTRGGASPLRRTLAIPRAGHPG